jgi:hypothetical protein
MSLRKIHDTTESGMAEQPVNDRTHEDVEEVPSLPSPEGRANTMADSQR